MKKMNAIADIFFGVNYPPDKNGDVPIIQSRSVGGFGEYDEKFNSRVFAEKLSGKDYLKPGDLLFAAKGVNNYPYVVQEKDLPAVASSIFFIIRVRSKNVLPEYLAWYLKTPQAKRWIDIISEGSTISSISIKEFRKFKVPVPDLKIQKNIIELQGLQNRYKTYSEKLVEKIELLNNEISNQLIEEKNE